MGLVYADFEVINGAESAMARLSRFDQYEVKRMWVNMLVDSGAEMLSINENIQAVLQLPVIENKTFLLADGSPVNCDIVGPVEIKFENRHTFCSAVVLPGNSMPLMGAIPIQDLDVVIHPKRSELIVHPEHPLMAHMIMKKKKALAENNF